MINKSQKVRQTKRSKDNFPKTIKLPYIQGTIDNIANIRWKKKIRVAFSPPNSLRRILDHAKDQIDPKKNKGVYSIPWSCNKIYIGKTGQSIQTRLKEHGADIIQKHSKKYALAEHSNITNHHICLEDANVIINMDHYTKRRVKEVIEIKKHPTTLIMMMGGN